MMAFRSGVEFVDGISSSIDRCFKTKGLVLSLIHIYFHDRTSQELVIEGRHDPCIVPRAVPVLESVMAITILDYLMEE